MNATKHSTSPLSIVIAEHVGQLWVAVKAKRLADHCAKNVNVLFLWVMSKEGMEDAMGVPASFVSHHPDQCTSDLRFALNISLNDFLT